MWHLHPNASDRPAQAGGNAVWFDLFKLSPSGPDLCTTISTVWQKSKYTYIWMNDVNECQHYQQK